MLLQPADSQDAAAALIEFAPEGILDAIPGARTLLVLFDPDRFDRGALSSLATPRRKSSRRTVVLQAAYDGPDLDALAAELRISREELRRRHVEAEHRVAFLGFAPGFAYMSGGFPVSRLPTPRVRVPAGSLAVADGFTGIYPAETPGGWRLIGRVAERMFDPRASPPSLLRPGDRVVFDPVEKLEPMPPPAPAQPPRDPALRIVKPGGCTTVQGAPRFGLSSYGVPAGGATDLAALAAANSLLGNEEGAAALEVTLAGPELLALRDLHVAFRGEVVVLRAGEVLRCGSVRSGLREYLAVAPGLELPPPGDARGPLRAGDEIGLSDGRAPRGRKPPRPGAGIRAVPGPQWECFAEPDAFFTSDWTVSPQSDRRGVRLQGPPLRLIGRADIPPEGTAPGAVQVPGDGLPIALGPDRPVTGGYAKIATILWDDLPVLAQARPGSRLRFMKARPR